MICPMCRIPPTIPLHYTRNRIRNQLPPEIEQYKQGAAGNILRLGRLAAQADEYLESQAAAWIKAHVRKNPGAYIPAEAFCRSRRYCGPMW